MKHVVRRGPNYTGGHRPAGLAENNTPGPERELRDHLAECTAEVVSIDKQIGLNVMNVWVHYHPKTGFPRGE